MFFFGLSLLFLLVGPLLHTFVKERPLAMHRFEHVILWVVTAAVVLHLLPSSYKSSGGWIFISLAIGFLLPLGLEKFWRRLSLKVDLITVSIVSFGLIVHSSLDGVALSQPFFSGWILPLVIVLHRIPDSILVWFSLCRYANDRIAVMGLLLMAVSTCFGYVFGLEFVQMLSSSMNQEQHSMLGHLQSLMVGSMVHLLLHRHHHRDDGCEPDDKHKNHHHEHKHSHHEGHVH